ncbi:elongation factor P 5-aminopentanone reductase [Longirhabdus pacifica]|uniref:elongation factor P 5-aminopentanone reductase n=1 Tax=Longirhabdus pacifica TaxID=2305227 RepID=UPI001008EF77|nr:3-oxoacyl-ACP reductase FabG [Longirhabdus pacifica]
MNKTLNEMTVLITGSSRGIGAAIAERFADIKMNIIIHYVHSHEHANQVARNCIAKGAKVMTVAGDISVSDEISKIKEKLDQHGLYPDIVINNAGISHYGMLMDTTEEQWDHIMNVNLKSMFLSCKAFAPYMISQKWGRIINISSVWGMTGASCETAYSASKGGVNAFTKALAKELAPSGVTVNAVAPGAVDTVMLNHLEQEEKQMLEQEIPLGRFATTDEIASMTYYLALPESSYITGQVLSPNGGWLT